MNLTSAAILFGSDAALVDAARGALAGHGWRTTGTRDIDVALAASAPGVALVLIDAGVEGAGDFLRQLRTQPQPIGGVPVLQYGGTRLSGTSALLPPPGDTATLVAALEHFAGALGDHALRSPPYSPFYRLVRLLGTRDAAAMIARFADTLRTAIDRTELPCREDAHRLAGLAGAIGYTELSLAWRAAEQGGVAAAAAAIDATRATLAEIARSDIARYGD